MVSTGGGGGKDVNTELNLTSMIDLMSCLVAFMLMGAVWMHIAAIPASVDVKGRAPASSTPKNNQLVVRVKNDGFQLAWPPLKTKAPSSYVRKNAEGYDLLQLTTVVEKVFTENADLTTSVSGDDTVPYGAIAEALDAVKAAGVVTVTLATH